MKRLVLLLLALVPATAAAGTPTEAEKIEALKLGYVLNGNSMVRWGSIDLSGPAPESALPKTDRIIPLTKKKDR
jgi:hypothetical protein